MKLLWLLFGFAGRLDAHGFTPWWAVYFVPVFFAGFASGTTSGGYLARGVLALAYFLLTLVPVAALATKRLRDAGRPLWFALPACLAMPLATVVLLAVQGGDIRPPPAYAAAAVALGIIAGWLFLMESLRRAPSAPRGSRRGAAGPG